jgi:hypothetical protein
MIRRLLRWTFVGKLALLFLRAVLATDAGDVVVPIAKSRKRRDLRLERRATYVFKRAASGRWLCAIDNSYGTDLLQWQPRPLTLSFTGSALSPSPIVFRFPPHRWRVRILALGPVR